MRRAGTTLASGVTVAIRFETRGCLWSILASVVLTIAVNVMLRACGAGPSW